MWNPIRALQQKGQQKIMQAIVLAALRNGLKLGGMAGMFSDSDVERAAGAVSVLLGLAMTGYNAWQDHQAKPAK